MPGWGDVQAPLWTDCTKETGLIVTRAGSGPHRHDAYHQATRSYPFLDMGQAKAFDTDNALMRQYTATDAYPSVYTDLPRSQRWPLAKAQTVADPSEEDGYRLPDQLALLLDGTLGERRRLDADDTGTYLQVELIFKAVPPGGARHPTEALLWLRAEGMPQGLYHYNVRANALDLLQNQPDAAELSAACPALPELTGGTGPVAVVMLASAVERPMWRYRDARSARAVLIDAGHVVQHLAELGAWLGWARSELPGFDARALAGHTGLDPDVMPVLAMGVLSR
ncbi:hypothetical protein [Streptomyces bluensis]|uniref:hypothetical protein n=1 Tax=Streptomyces bluensis TaxID=33897 RepID=UPI001676223B|nr:hypothetical protein [Streptomyces bluensis]GGZ70134.1 hypothetical protein GCM10010344_41400 [Streptomyces bluensis]